MASPPGSTGTSSASAGGLALHMQELFTVVARIRADRQVADDVEAFRAHVKRLMARADREAREAGYADETVRYAVYALIALLDESVLNSPRELFSAWAGRPLQEEVFGDHMAGETFYAYLDALLEGPADPERADLLEVYLLCLLLGFRGRYGSADSGERAQRTRRAREIIDRVRGGRGPMAPRWAVPEDEAAPPRLSDPWVPRLAVVALACVLLGGALWLAFRALLAGGGA